MSYFIASNTGDWDRELLGVIDVIDDPKDFAPFCYENEGVSNDVICIEFDSADTNIDRIIDIHEMSCIFRNEISKIMIFPDIDGSDVIPNIYCLVPIIR